MKIIRAGAADAEKLTSIALNSKRYWKYPEQWMTHWTKALTITPDYVFWNDVYSALNGDRVIGFYALVLKRAKLRLEHLWVDPEHIGSGAGRLLLRHAVARAAKINAGPIEIISDPNAEGFYLKMGAKRIGEEITEVRGTNRILPRLQIEI